MTWTNTSCWFQNSKDICPVSNNFHKFDGLPQHPMEYIKREKCMINCNSGIHFVLGNHFFIENLSALDRN